MATFKSYTMTLLPSRLAPQTSKVELASILKRVTIASLSNLKKAPPTTAKFGSTLSQSIENNSGEHDKIRNTHSWKKINLKVRLYTPTHFTQILFLNSI